MIFVVYLLYYKNYTELMENVNTIVCEGGGIYGIAYLEGFKELQSKIDVIKSKNSCGTSVASLIVFGQALGLKPEHMGELLIQDDMFIESTDNDLEDALEYDI